MNKFGDSPNSNLYKHSRTDHFGVNIQGKLFGHWEVTTVSQQVEIIQIDLKYWVARRLED
uniref:Uncharacterized protein n=1 Tax=Romanomermis culicivorax TaxID=13658 RepID=A0A915J8X0_ROMCU